MSKFFFRLVVAFIIIFSLVFLYARYVEPFRLTSVELTFENSHAAESTPDITIAVFSDVHFDDSNNYTIDNFERVINTINDRNPDIILFLGDLIDDYAKYTRDVKYISEALAKLDARLGKFAVYGNHDHGGGAHKVYREIMANGGFTVFQNEYIKFEDYNILLIGLDDFVLGSGDISIVSESVRNDFFNVVFCHVPDVIDAILDYSVDFMIAGHTHGSQINLGQARSSELRNIFFPPHGRNYVRGTYFFDNAASTTLHVNSGVGTTILPLRFLAPPEVTFITITTP